MSTRTFRNTTGYGFTIYAPSQTLRVEADADFTTDDDAVAQILADSGRVAEVKATSKKSDAKSESKSESSGSKKDD